jgi:AraC-like DNA-binding protein
MKSLQLLPSPALADHVEIYWAMETVNQGPGRERVLPSGTTELVFDLDGPSLVPVVCGPHDAAFEMRRARRDSFVGVHFKPGGAASLLGVPASELANLRIGLDALWGRAARELGARLVEAPTASVRLQLLERALLARLERRVDAHPGVAYALDELAHVPAPRSIGEIAARAGLSARRFIALFDAQVGLTPKLFARVRRFQKLLHLAHPRPAPAWAQLALDCGYFDQAHLSRDFGEFAGLAPGAYARLRSHDPNHVALPIPA